MAAIVKLPSGRWRAQVRRNKKYVSRTFLRNADATSWAKETELAIDKGLSIATVGSGPIKSFGQVIDLHVRDMHDVGKVIRRSKQAVLEALKRELGATLLKNLNRTTLIDYGKRRAKAGAVPATLAIDFSFIGTLLTDAAAVHGVDVPLEDVKLARVALTRLGLIGKSQERDRRPTQEELDRLTDYFDGKERQYTPMSRIVRFAVATAMRLEEICSVLKRKLVFARVGSELRIAGLADVGPRDPEFKDDRLQTLSSLSQQAFDAPMINGIDGTASGWAGNRPCTPSSRPLTTRGHLPGVYLNMGHGTLGWTLGLGSAQKLASIIAEDMKP